MSGCITVREETNELATQAVPERDYRGPTGGCQLKEAHHPLREEWRVGLSLPSSR